MVSEARMGVEEGSEGSGREIGNVVYVRKFDERWIHPSR